MISERVILLAVVFGITFNGAFIHCAVQGKPSSVVRLGSTKAVQSRQISFPVSKRKLTNTNERDALTSTSNHHQSSVPGPLLFGTKESQTESQNENGSEKVQASQPIRPARQIEGRIERKKRPGFKEFLKDEVDGPIHPVSSNNKNL